MQQLEDEFQRLIVVARDEARKDAAEDTLEDAMILLTGMRGAPEMRKILLAVVGLDDILASGQLGDVERLEVLEVQGILRAALDGGGGGRRDFEADELNEYAVAMFMIGSIYGDISRDVYNRLEEVHLEVLAAEEAEEAEEAAMVATMRQSMELAAATAAAAATPAPEDQKERMIAARLARFG